MKLNAEVIAAPVAMAMAAVLGVYAMQLADGHRPDGHRPDGYTKRLAVLERNARIDSITDAELEANPDYTDTAGGYMMMGPQVNPVMRSTRWHRVQREHLKVEWWCRYCGTTSNLQVHHVVPFHVDPSHELDASNLLTLCMSTNRCHLMQGHLGDFKLYNTNIVKIATNTIRM